MLLRPTFSAMASYLSGHAIMILARLVTAVRGEWKGVEPIPTQRLYFANHVSHGDFVLIWTTLPGRLRYRTRPVAGADYWLSSPLKKFIGEKVFRAVLIDRKPKRGSITDSNRASQGSSEQATVKEVTHTEEADAQAPLTCLNPIQTMTQAIQNGDSLILFPEGTRNTTANALLPFKSGLYHFAKANPSVELVPVWIDNLHRVLPKGEFIPVPLACTVKYGVAIELEQNETKKSFMQKAEHALLSTGNTDTQVLS